MLLAVKGLEVAFGERTVLGGVDFGVARGEAFGLLGENGAGKSTAMQALVGMLRPRAGSLELDGRVVGFGDRRLRERLGVVFQGQSLDGRLDARQNLALAASLYGIGSAQAGASIDELLAWTQLGERAGEPVARFSGGMRRRLEIARALLSGPEILLCDEPTAGLDEHAFRSVWERLDELRRTRGLAVMVTTHRPEEAERCDRLAILDGGKIVAEGTPEELKQRVSGDLVIVEADDPIGLAAELGERLGLEARVQTALAEGMAPGTVIIEKERGHELIPRLIEALPAGRLKSVSLRRPGLADVFLKLTGRSLGRAQAAAPVEKKRGRRAA
jgi:ABC-2 type transport system ATP-binding protein